MLRVILNTGGVFFAATVLMGCNKSDKRCEGVATSGAASADCVSCLKGADVSGDTDTCALIGTDLSTNPYTCSSENRHSTADITACLTSCGADDSDALAVATEYGQQCEVVMWQQEAPSVNEETGQTQPQVLM